MERVEAWAAARSARIGGRNPWSLAVRFVRRFAEIRVTGLAAELTYYSLLSAVPLLVALGTTLGLLERFLGLGQARKVEDALVQAMETVFSPELAEDVMSPLVRSLMHEERIGVAVFSLLLAFWLASRAFRAAIHALDVAHRIDERRSLSTQWATASALAVGALLVTVLILAMLVIGPLLGGGRQLAEWIGVGRAFEVVWSVGRYPVALVITAGYLLALYQVGPNASIRWRSSLPGALAGAVGVALVAIGFRLYIETAGPRIPDVRASEEAVRIAARTVGATLATVLLVWLTSIVVLAGGLLNAELGRTPAASRR